MNLALSKCAIPAHCLKRGPAHILSLRHNLRVVAVSDAYLRDKTRRGHFQNEEL